MFTGFLYTNEKLWTRCSIIMKELSEIMYVYTMEYDDGIHICTEKFNNLKYIFVLKTVILGICSNFIRKPNGIISYWWDY